MGKKEPTERRRPDLEHFDFDIPTPSYGLSNEENFDWAKYASRFVFFFVWL